MHHHKYLNLKGKIIDIRGMVLVEKKYDARSYFFYMPVGAPYSDAAQCAINIAEEIRELQKKAAEAEEKRKKEAEAAEDNKSE